ncbi:CapA family protein [Candidatus Gracilibacteria bacterium]|nr:CapA family protein [Candidatus Gracilibacteria bacterium]
MIKKNIYKQIKLFSLFLIIFLVFVIFQNEYQAKNIKQTKIIKVISIQKDIYKNLESNKDSLNILFFGDLIYDRGVYSKLSGEKELSNHFQYRYNQKSEFNEIKATFDKIAQKFDFVIFNMEGPIGKYYETDQNGNIKKIRKCSYPYKSISFCSYADILPFMKKLGFNAVNLANNHVMDGGIPGHLETIKQLDKNQIKYFGYIYGGNNYQKNYVLTGQKNNIKYARHGYDYSVYYFLQDKYCKDLKEYKKNGYTNLASVHRGAEYNPIHSQTQENIAKYLIKCGADLIVGHHPHVVQDFQVISGVQVIYSLGNFLFDQYFSEATKLGGYALIDFKLNKKTTIVTGTIDAYAD